MKFDSNLLKTYMLSVLITMLGFLFANYFSSFTTQADFNVLKSQVMNQQETLKEIQQDVRLIRDLLLGIDLPNPKNRLR